MPPREHRRIKLTDIAEKTGFTVGTISKALQNKEGISQETRETILKAAKEIGYIANSQAGGLRSGSTKTVAIIISDITNPFFAIEIKTCVSILEKYGYSAIVMGTEESAEREEQAIISAINKNVDGVLLCPTQHNTRGIELLQQNGMPFVLMGRRFADLDTDYVICNDEQGGYLAGQHLAQLGHRRIMIITANPRISSSCERLRGFRRAMSEMNIPVAPELIHESDVSAHDAVRIIEDALASRQEFTAVFAFSDYIAWEIIYTLNRYGLRVPEDVSVVGFDDVQSHMYFPPPLTTIHTPTHLISTQSVELLLGQIRGRANDATHLMLETKLVVRSTTSLPRAGSLSQRIQKHFNAKP